MPHINGWKYSCEPCIRGHRATSCAHTDRVLVEVRKPGRPLQSCGHRLATCVCGRLTDSCFIGDTVTAPLRPRQRSPSTTGQSKSKSRTWNQSRPRKRPRTKPQSSNASLSEDAQKCENITTTKNREQSEEFGKLNNTIQQPDILQEPGPYQTSDTVVSPTYSVAQLPPEDYAPTHFIRPMTALCTASEARSYPAKSDARLPEKSQHPYFLGQGATQTRASLSRIKDVSIISNTESSRQNGDGSIGNPNLRSVSVYHGTIILNAGANYW